MLSNESKQFLENLRLYLYSTGKKESEIKEVIEELESHLMEAEANGKSVEAIIGQSPREYMESIADELDFAKKESLMAGLGIILGACSIYILSEVIQGSLALTLLELIGSLVILVSLIGAFVGIIRILSRENTSDRKSSFIIGLIGSMPLFAFIALFLLDARIASPSIVLEGWPVYLIGGAALLIILLLSFWLRSWLLILAVLVVTLPYVLQRIFKFSDLVTMVFMIGLILCLSMVMLLLVRKKEKK